MCGLHYQKYTSQRVFIFCDNNWTNNWTKDYCRLALLFNFSYLFICTDIGTAIFSEGVTELL